MLRWLGVAVVGLAMLLIAAGAAVYFFADSYNFGPIAARRASAALGRTVSIGSLHVTPGRWIRVELRDARLDNLPGGSRPAMVEVASLTAEVQATSLLHRPVVIRSLVVDGLRILLERGADKTPNWRFGPPKLPAPAPASVPASRSWVPTLLDAKLAGEVVFRQRGSAFRTRLDDLLIHTGAADQPVRLTGSGTYNDIPFSIEADLASIDTLRDAAVAYPADVRLASGATSLRFTGTMADPLDVDGVRGTLALAAPTPEVLSRIPGIALGVAPALRLAGSAEHAGPLWQLTDASGALGGAAIKAAAFRFVEGARGTADTVSADLAFDQLDLDALAGAGTSGNARNADLPLSVDRAPDTLIDARLSARGLSYAQLRASDIKLAAALTPGRMEASELALTYLGARLRASGRIDALAGSTGRPGGQVTADVKVFGMSVQRLRELLGLQLLPLQGPMDARIAATGTGTTLNQAARGARISAVLAMSSGSVARNVVELASVNPLALLRTARGMSALSCLLGILDMRAGAGTVSPLRLRTQNGTIAGSGRFDLYRRTMDLTVGSESRTTGVFALDVPVRASGSFASPTIRPARWSAAGRAQLAASDDVTRLLPGLQPFASKSPCLGARRSQPR